MATLLQITRACKSYGDQVLLDHADATLSDDDATEVVTFHRSKGLEWDVVVVAGVQEESWPDLRLRGSLLGVDELAETARPDRRPDQGQGPDVDAAMLAAKHENAALAASQVVNSSPVHSARRVKPIAARP